jgi:hypothetical protein
MGTITGRGQAIEATIIHRNEEIARGVVMPITMMGMVAVKEMAQTPPTTT